ncbi:Unknown protein sequence [Pseudomonas amygdali pv. lachrymans]|nr:Unknown protein sequence [Pseudomonas syringae pv. maculicola str. M6]KPC09789.1 Unknown protein sequence [Pseudomonas amygdali pv. lachrymans]
MQLGVMFLNPDQRVRQRARKSRLDGTDFQPATQTRANIELIGQVVVLG